MKKTLTLFTLLALFIGCDNEPKKEKFSYKRVQETPTEQKISSSNEVVINSNDQMLFDRSVKGKIWRVYKSYIESHWKNLLKNLWGTILFY